MIRFLAKRLASLCTSLLIASLVIFMVIEVVPGDPAAFMLGMNARPDTVAALRTELGLDGTAIERYLAWVSGMVQGDFGVSYAYRTPVSEMIADRLWISLPLALLALTLTIVIAIPAGIFAASRRQQPGDYGVIAATQVGIAVPNFWFAMILILIFAINLGWFSAGGFPGWNKGFWTSLQALVLPAVALALPQAAILTRIMRSALIDVLGEDYIRTARAKGLSQRLAIWRHGLRNALIPVLTIIGLQFAFLLAGAIIIEQVFSLPGLGRLLFQSISQRDLIVVENIVMLLVFAVIMTNFLVDLAYAAVDPRLRKAH